MEKDNVSLWELVENDPFFREQKHCLTYNFSAEDLKMPLRDHPSGQGEDVRESFFKWKELAITGKYEKYALYSEKEIAEDSKKQNVWLLHLKGQKDAPFCMICPGGGYMDCVLWGEGITSAINLVENHGINAFILFYRVNEPGLLPKPVEDLAKAIKFVMDNSEKLQVSSKNYAVAGFSAGGHLACEWGDEKRGYKKYGLPKPAALLLGYPAVAVEYMYDTSHKENWSNEGKDADDAFFQCIAGSGYTREKLENYSALYNMTEDFPPCYLVHARNDNLVSFESAEKFVECLRKNGIFYKNEFKDLGGHGFSMGKNTPFEGWFDRAVNFWNQCS